MKKTKKRLITVILILLSVAILTSSLFVYASFAPYGRHKVENTEYLITEKIIEPPDSIAVIRFGIAIEVSAEKRDQIYAVFAQAFEEQQPKYGSCFCTITKDDITKWVLFNLNIEFRYKQRRRSNGKYYDAVMFTFNKKYELIPIFFQNGQYRDQVTHSSFGFDKAYFADFKKTIKGII